MPAFYLAAHRWNRNTVMRIALWTLLAVVAGSQGAHADWLTDAWSDPWVAAHGNPSITLHADGIAVTLPTETLDQAHEAGLTTRDALAAFVVRYSPQCSG